ncbi:MAG TPA: response regulator transcription factor [Azospirillaceae bacterium]|nr:response regulator transcription factor [Azospirillaceae bacterium]
MQTVNILLIDGSTLFRQGIRQLLPSDFVVVGEARSDAEALDMIRDGLTADVILVDCDGGSVRSVVAGLKAAAPASHVVHLTTSVDVARLRAALEAGASGYVTKDRTPQALAQALRLVMMGEKVFPSDLAQLLVQGAATEMGPSAGHKGLSTRESQILRGLVQGHSNKMIALNLNITEATVKVHLKSLLRKIRASNRTQAAIWALHNGFEANEMAA